MIYKDSDFPMIVTLNNGKQYVCTGVERHTYIFTTGNSYNNFWIPKLNKFVEEKDIYSFDGKIKLKNN